MCGIVGQIGPGACDEGQLLRMMGMLNHRGPDEAGLLLGRHVAWGHLRLSIVDLESGQQPMSSHDGRYWVVFNGEIFNHIELRTELEGRGHVFQTRSDTEVLINSYREWGAECLHRLNGQWAFALWDSHNETYFLARDRWGTRPLFYTVLADRKTIVFASEIKAILVDERVARQWDPQALKDIFISWVSEHDRTPVKGIRQLQPGHCLEISDGDFRVRRWWTIDYSPDLVEWNREERSWLEELEPALSDACRIRLRADVPVGSYLSGGLDSSIVACLARTHHRNEIRTFSIAFEDAAYDESVYQRLMAGHLGTTHSEVRITGEHVARSFPEAIWHAETPIYRTAPVPMLHLSRLVRDSGLKVVLTGEGADELFAGYDQFKEVKIRRFWASHPQSRWRKRLLDRLEQGVPGAEPRNRAFWYAFYQQDLRNTGAAGYSHRLRWHNGLSLLQLFDRAFLDGASAGTDDGNDWIATAESSVPSGFHGWHALSKAQYWETRQLLSGYLLSSQGDRMAMAHSVEGRYPFLDMRVYDIVRRMPPHLKLRALCEKHILKQLFKRRLPQEVIQRVKNPYRAPDAAALLCTPAAREAVRESLAPAAVRRRGLFNPGTTQKLLDRISGSRPLTSRDHMALVLLYSTHLFNDIFLESRLAPKTLPRLARRVDLTSCSTTESNHFASAGIQAT